MWTKLIPVAVAVVLLGGCATGERHIDNLAFDASPSQNIDAKMKALDDGLASARAENVHLLSPRWFWSAQNSLKDAQELRNSGGDFNKLAHEVAEGEAQLQRAKEFAELSRTQLSDVLRARNEAVIGYKSAEAAGVTRMGKISEDMVDADTYLMSLTERIEDGDSIGDKRLVAIRQYQKLRVAGLQKAALGEAKRTIEVAENEGADSYVPKTLAATKEQVKAADTFIENNPDAAAQIQEKGNELIAQSNRVLALTREARAFDDRSPEESALFVEGTLKKVGEAIGVQQATLTPKRFDEQADLIASSASQTRGTAATATTLQRKVSKMIDPAKMQALRAKFAPNEVEVIEKDGQTVLRLKALQFASGQSALSGDNFTLLGKVADALRDYPGANIVIEGHTDATGSAEANSKLSQARAESVLNYLVSNGALNKDHASAVGRGFERPIASGKTQAGRAANRRIDVVIGSTSPKPLAE